MGNFYVISGDDDFARKQRARETAAMLCGCDDPESAEEMEIIPGDQIDLKADDIAGKFLSALRTPPFLCDRKVVWMRHHPDLEYFSKDKLSALAQELVDTLSSPLPEDLAVIIDGPGLDKRKTVFKNWKNNGAELESFNIAKASDRNFAENRKNVLYDFARSSGKKIRPDAMQYLTDVIGGDSGTLANELEKLACYTGAKTEITLDDCRAIVSRTPEAVIWEYTEAIQNRSVKNALLCLELLSSQNESGLELKLLALLSNTYQKMLGIRQAMSELQITRVSASTFEMIPEDIKNKFPKNQLLKIHPYRAFKMCESACRIDGKSLSDKLTLIRNTYRSIVSGAGEPRILLEQLTIKLAS